MQNKQIFVKKLGKVSYAPTWSLQTNLQKQIVDIKLANRKRTNQTPQTTPNYLLLCSHPPVYTLGKSGKESHLLLNKEQLEKKGIEYHKINRGGDITYHGPGQIVGYPILDLSNFFTDIHKYLRLLEEMVIATLAEYGINAGRIAGATGVWLDAHKPHQARKICAYGIRCTRWVTMHGWAFNVNTNLDYFKHIIPCGIADKGVTSLHTELGVAEVNTSEVAQKMLKHFARLFNADLVNYHKALPTA